MGPFDIAQGKSLALYAVRPHARCPRPRTHFLLPVFARPLSLLPLPRIATIPACRGSGRAYFNSGLPAKPVLYICIRLLARGVDDTPVCGGVRPAAHNNTLGVLHNACAACNLLPCAYHQRKVGLRKSNFLARR